jgi:hypothetical protein
VVLDTKDGNLKSLDVVSRAGLKVVGTTDTAVGEVGVRVTLLAKAEALGGENRSHVTFGDDGYWGWWRITPELTLAGGIAGSLGDSSNAFDNRCTCAYQDTGGAFGHDDPTQIRLTYESGPISFAIAVEDEGNTTTKSALGVAGEFKYSGDTIGFDLNAGYWDSKRPELDVGVGEDRHVAGNADRYAKASAFLGFTLSDAVSAEFGGAYTDYKGNAHDYTVAGGLYYTPVAQLTLGLETSYRHRKNAINGIGDAADDFVDVVTGPRTRADVIAIWRF